MCIIEQIHIDINDMGERFLSGEQIYDMSKTKTGEICRVTKVDAMNRE